MAAKIGKEAVIEKNVWDFADGEKTLSDEEWNLGCVWYRKWNCTKIIAEKENWSGK